jgi:hypothetical protein
MRLNHSTAIVSVLVLFETKPSVRPDGPVAVRLAQSSGLRPQASTLPLKMFEYATSDKQIFDKFLLH